MQDDNQDMQQLVKVADKVGDESVVHLHESSTLICRKLLYRVYGPITSLRIGKRIL